MTNAVPQSERPVVPLQDVESSQIAAIGYLADQQILAIRFYRGWGENKKPGSLYQYRNFTAEDFEAFKTAESLGRHFGQNIKPFSDKYPYEQIAEDVPAAA